MHDLPELQSFESPSTCSDSVMVKVEDKLYLLADSPVSADSVMHVSVETGSRRHT